MGEGVRREKGKVKRRRTGVRGGRRGEMGTIRPNKCDAAVLIVFAGRGQKEKRGERK